MRHYKTYRNLYGYVIQFQLISDRCSVGSNRFSIGLVFQSDRIGSGRIESDRTGPDIEERKLFPEWVRLPIYIGPVHLQDAVGKHTWTLDAIHHIFFK